MADIENALTTATTRERVLRAAMVQFLTQPYDKATLRSIARKAGVDVAYVHRLFGSKQILFGEVLSAIFEREVSVWRPSEGLLESAAAVDTVDDGVMGIRGTDPIDLLIHSLGNPEARSTIVDFLKQHVLSPLEASFEGPEAMATAEKIFAFLIGVRITRRFIGLKSLEGHDSRERREWLMTTIQCISGGLSK